MKKLFKSSLASNFVSLSSIQGLNYLIPFITLPYIVRVIGIEEFGLISFAGALTSYFIMITDYGFNLSAVKEISINRNDHIRLNEIINSVFSVKIILFFISLIIFIPSLFLLTTSKKEIALFCFSFISVLGSVLTPTWYYMGIEKIKFLAIINLVFKVCFVILVFIWVTNNGDVLIYVLLNSITSCIIGIFSFLYMVKISCIRFQKTSYIELKRQIYYSGLMFVSSIGISFYTTSNIFIIGLFAPIEMVGLFAIADKILQITKSFFSTIVQSLYPFIAQIASDSIQNGLVMINKALRVTGLLGGILSLVVFLNAKNILIIILGNSPPLLLEIIKILSAVPFVFSIAIVTSNLFLLGFGFAKIWSRLYISLSILSVLSALFFIILFNNPVVAISINIVFIESLGMVISLLFYLKLKEKVLTSV